MMIKVKDILTQRPKGAYIYRIMYNADIPFYIGCTLSNVQARFKTHMAKYYGEKKHPDRPNCQEIICEHADLKFKCTGRQTYGYSQIRALFKRLNINYDLYNADVILEQYSEDAVDPRGIDLMLKQKWALTNKFYIERIETDMIATEHPLANDETVHLAEKKLYEKS